MSDFWVAKMGTFFRRFDADNDGEFSNEDVELMAERFGEITDDDDRKQTIRELLFQFYNAYAKDWNGKLTEERLIDGIKRVRNDPGFAATIREMSETVLHLLDADGDGFVQEEEYVKFFYILSINDHERLAKLVFESLDTNGDGKLSLEEIRDGFRDFLLSEDETGPGVNFFGPLL